MYNKRFVFWAACLGMLLFGIALITLGSVAPSLRMKFALDEISAGTLFSILPLGVLAGSLVFGPFCDKFGYKLLLVLSALLLFAGFEGLAFTPSKDLLKIFIFLIGLGGGAINGATNAVVADISENEKGADLSLLGVFFGIGALGMPVILGILEKRLSYEIIVASVGGLTLVTAILFGLMTFPPAKQAQGIPISGTIGLVKDGVLLMIAFFLFFQSSFEAIMNNWTTTFIIDRYQVTQDKALFALSSFVAGMSVMRLLIGSVLRKVQSAKILFSSFGLIFISLILLRINASLGVSFSGLFLLGAGLASGFPMMLGFVAARFASLSGTAFSIAISIALLGNMLINYLMGIIAKNFGVENLITVAFIEMAIMITMSLFIIKKLKTNK